MKFSRRLHAGHHNAFLCPSGFNLLPRLGMVNRKPHSLQYANDYELHHKGSTRDQLKQLYIEKLKALQPNIQVDYWKKIKAAGLWDAGEISNVYYQNGKLYYLYDLAQMEIYEKYFVGKAGFERETEKYNQKKQIAENAASIAIVIPCYIMKWASGKWKKRSVEQMYYIKRSEWLELEKNHSDYCGKSITNPKNHVIFEGIIPGNNGKGGTTLLTEGISFKIVDDGQFTKRKD